MDSKLLSKLRAAEQMRRDNEREAKEKATTRAMRDARSEGYQQGSQQVRALERAMTHPVAEQLLKEMGRRLADGMATEAAKNNSDVPPSIIHKCAEEVWNWVQTAPHMPLEEVIKIVVNHDVRQMEHVMTMSIPALTVSLGVPERAFKEYRYYG